MLSVCRTLPHNSVYFGLTPAVSKTIFNTGDWKQGESL